MNAVSSGILIILLIIGVLFGLVNSKIMTLNIAITSPNTSNNISSSLVQTSSPITTTSIGYSGLASGSAYGSASGSAYGSASGSAYGSAYGSASGSAYGSASGSVPH